jgi:hypothetical protein
LIPWNPDSLDSIDSRKTKYPLC